jgi:hypothetical protein
LNQKFYNNELIVLTEENHRDKPLVVYKTAKGNQIGDQGDGSADRNEIGYANNSPREKQNRNLLYNS